MEGKRAEKKINAPVISGNAACSCMLLYVQYLLNRLCKSSALGRSMGMRLDFGFFFKEYTLDFFFPKHPKRNSRGWLLPGFLPSGVKAELQFHSCWLSQRFRESWRSLQDLTSINRFSEATECNRLSTTGFQILTSWLNPLVKLVMNHFQSCQDRQKTRQR